MKDQNRTPAALRAQIERLGLSQRAAARLIGVSERMMRSYLANDAASTAARAPITVALALEAIERRLAAVREAITPAMLADYLTADSGDWLALFTDGSYRIFCGSEVPNRDFTALATVKCPGIGNLDSTHITDRWCEMDDDIGQYVVIGEHHADQGRVIGDLDDAIREACRDGDMTDHMEDLERSLVESALEILAENASFG